MADIASAAGGSGGGRRDGDEPPRGPPPPVDVPEDQEEVEDEEAGSEEDEPQIGRRIQCQTCMRWVLRSVGLERHAPKCVGYRRFKGDFACTFPGCHSRRSYFHDLTKHYRKKHPGRPIPQAIRNYTP